MAKVKLFTKKDCPRCPEAKALVAQLENVEFFDVGEVEGLAEAAFYGVMSTPSIVITDEMDKEITGWRGIVPKIEELKRVC